MLISDLKFMTPQRAAKSSKKNSYLTARAFHPFVRCAVVRAVAKNVKKIRRLFSRSLISLAQPLRNTSVS